MLAFSGGAAHRTSLNRDDLDLFVVAKHRRAWTALAGMIGVCKVLGVRSDVCANYLVDEEHLKVELQHDIYTAHQLIHLWPVLGEMAYRRFYQENTWVAELFPNAAPRGLAPEGHDLAPHRAAALGERLLELGGAGTEVLARALLTTYLRLRHRGNTGNAWLGPGIIKLHMKDHRAPTLRRFAERLAKVAGSFPSTRSLSQIP